MTSFVTQFPSLDIRALAKGRWLYPYSKCEWVWRSREGILTGGISLFALKDSIVLSYRQGQQSISDKVQILYSAGAKGEKRPWFECPGCYRRVALLYKFSRGFRCRRCWGLKYESQYSSRGRSYGRKRSLLTRSGSTFVLEL